MISDGKEQTYNMDYACGCNGTTLAERQESYLNQTHDPSTASCGLVVIGMDVYTLNSEWGDASQTKNIEGTTWTYMPQSDISIAEDLSTTIKAVNSGTLEGGRSYSYGYTFDYPSGNANKGCTVTYKADFFVPPKA